MARLVLVLVWTTALLSAQPTTVQPAAPNQEAAPTPERAFPGRITGQITRRLATGTGDIALPDQAGSGERVFVSGSFGRLVNTVCRSRFIAIGTLVSVETRLNHDASSLYSEWQFRITSPPLKATDLADASAGATLGLFMRGGRTELEGRTVSVANRDFHSGLEPGAEFLVFARTLAGTGPLVATAGFRLEADTVRRASQRPIYPEAESMSRRGLLTKVGELIAKTSANPDCGKTGA